MRNLRIAADDDNYNCSSIADGKNDCCQYSCILSVFVVAVFVNLL